MPVATATATGIDCVASIVRLFVDGGGSGMTMDPISIDTVTEQVAQGDDRFVEFLRRDSMSLEVYRLDVGEDDPQDRHSEDEVYYVVSGTAKIRIGDDSHDIEDGDIIFVEREVEHYFFDIEETLVTLVFFTPPFGTLAES